MELNLFYECFCRTRASAFRPPSLPVKICWIYAAYICPSIYVKDMYVCIYRISFHETMYFIIVTLNAMIIRPNVLASSDPLKPPFIVPSSYRSSSIPPSPWTVIQNSICNVINNVPTIYSWLLQAYHRSIISL
jgi:hypothetical protein